MNLIEDSFKLFLSPSGATIKNNGELNSSCKFKFKNPFALSQSLVYQTIRIIHCEIPFSFYIINEYNNKLVLSTGTYLIPFGNYQASTLQTTLLSILPAGFSFTFSDSTGKYSIQYTSSFSILAGSNCGLILGFTNGTQYNSVLNKIDLPYQANMLGTKNLYIQVPNIILTNTNFTLGGNNTTLANIPVDVPPYSLIFYTNKTNTFSIIKTIQELNEIDINILDDNGNLVDFNNQDWNITIEINNFLNPNILFNSNK